MCRVCCGYVRYSPRRSFVGRVPVAYLQPNSTLTALDLSFKNIGPAEIELLASALSSPAQQHGPLQTLVLRFNSIGSANGSVALGEALKVNRSLTSLDLCNNWLGVSGVDILAQCLGAAQPPPHQLALMGPSTIQFLDISQNAISTARGVDCLNRGLFPFNTSLLSIELADDEQPLTAQPNSALPENSTTKKPISGGASAGNSGGAVSASAGAGSAASNASAEAELNAQLKITAHYLARNRRYLNAWAHVSFRTAIERTLQSTALQQLQQLQQPQPSKQPALPASLSPVALSSLWLTIRDFIPVLNSSFQASPAPPAPAPLTAAAAGAGAGASSPPAKPTTPANSNCSALTVFDWNKLRSTKFVRSELSAPTGGTAPSTTASA